MTSERQTLLTACRKGRKKLAQIAKTLKSMQDEGRDTAECLEQLNLCLFLTQQVDHGCLGDLNYDDLVAKSLQLQSEVSKLTELINNKL